MGKLDNIFKKIADASANGGGNNIRDGIYDLVVEKCVLNDEAHSGTCFIVEFRVLSAAPSGALDETGKPVVPNPVGTTCSLVCNVTKHESAFGNLKKFLVPAASALGVAPEGVDDDLIKRMFLDEPELLRGVVVHDETYRGVNKGRANAANAGKPLTLNKWSPVEQDADDIERMKEWLSKPATPAAAEPARAAMSTAPAATEAAPAKKLLGSLKKTAQ